MALAGCATTLPAVKPILPTSGIPGIYHRIEKGQTLWAISKMYDVDLDKLVSINRISDVTNIEIGQMIFIPDVQKNQTINITSYASNDFIWPVRGRIIANFGQIFNNMINKGINIEPYSNPEVIAARSGKVVFYAQSFGSFGKTLIVDHGDGFSTVYARNSEVFIKAGDNVAKGTAIAKVGSAGNDKHKYLHFEIRKGYTAKNPNFYLPH